MEDIQSVRLLSSRKPFHDVNSVFHRYYAAKLMPSSPPEAVKISVDGQPSLNMISHSNITSVSGSTTETKPIPAVPIDSENKRENKLEEKPASVNILCSMTENLLFVEKNNVVEKFELIGTMTAAVTRIHVEKLKMNNSSTHVDSISPSVIAISVDITDAKTVLKSILLNKSLKCSKPPIAQDKYQQFGVRWTDAAAETHFGSTKNASGSSAEMLTDFHPAVPIVVPVLRYTCVDSLRPVIMKARHAANMSAPHVISFIAQVNLNPKFASVIRDFKMYASIAALLRGHVIKKVSFGEDPSCIGDFQSATKMLSWTIAEVNGNDQSKLTFQASVELIADSAQQTSPVPNTDSFSPMPITEQVPLMVKAVYEGVLLSSVDMDIQSDSATESAASALTAVYSNNVEAVTRRSTIVECRFL
jgi:hypothetical protein